MSDLISRKVLLEALKKSRKCHAQDGRELELLCRCENIVNEQPPVEAVPVVHGEWIYNRNYTWECSECGFRPFKGYIPKEPGFNFCPNCGSDMRKKV